MLKRILFTTAFLAMFSPTGSWAFLPFACPPVPVCPMPDIPDELASLMEGIADLGRQVQSLKNQVTNDANNIFSALKSVYEGNLSTAIDVSKDNAGQRALENCIYKGKEYKNTSVEDVFDLSRKVLLEYPSNDTIIKQAYNENRDKFYAESMWEIYTAVRVVEEELNNTVIPKIEETRACITGDSEKCGIGSPDASNDAAFIIGKAYEAVDNLYQVMVKITALKAQLVAVKAIRDIQPEDYEDISEIESGDEQASLDIENKIIMASSHYSVQDDLFFASATPETPNDDNSESTEFEFYIAPDSPEKHAYVYEADKIEELNKIAPFEEKVSLAKEVHNRLNSLESYKQAAQSVEDVRTRYQEALEALKQAQACTTDYVCSYFTISSPEECNEICYGSDPENAGGILGWAEEYYEAIKAVKTAETNSGDVPVLNFDYEEDSGDTSKFDTSAAKNVLDREDASINNSRNIEKQSEENRRSNLISWQVGAEVSKMLAANPAEWGKNPKSQNRLKWFDEKNFYNQYLTKKYANIKTYLKSFITADVLNVVADYFEGKTLSISETPYQKFRYNLFAQLEAELAEIAKDPINDSKLKDLQRQRNSLAAKIDALNAKHKENLDKLSALRDKAHEDAGQSISDKVNYVETFPNSINDPTPDSPPIEGVVSFSERSEEFTSNTLSNKEESDIKGLEKTVKEQEAELTKLEDRLKKLDEEIIEYKLSMQLSVNSEAVAFSKKRQTLLDKALDLISEEETSSHSQVKDRLISVIKNKLIKDFKAANPDAEVDYEEIAKQAITAYNDIEKSAMSSLSGLYTIADSVIDATLRQLLNMGDALYSPKSHQQIVNIHQQMMQQLGALTISVNCGIMPSISSISIFSKTMLADATPEMEDYFVGYPAKSRDLRAPKAMFEQNLPNIREMFHFDDVDFQNVKPISEKRGKDNTPISNKDFLNYGGEIPQAWKYILRDFAFVETPISMDKILTLGCESEMFFRQGTLPCRIKGSNTAVDINAKGEYVPVMGGPDLHECNGLTIKDNHIYHGAHKVNVRTGDATADTNCKYSELGIFLTINSDNQLMFKDNVYDAFYTLWKEDKQMDDSKNHKKDLASVENAPFARNQIGNYLVYKENEKMTREQLEETENDYKEKQAELLTFLRNFGYEPAEDINLADDAVYNEVRSSIDEIKNALIDEAKSLQQNIKTEDNPVVAERVDTLKNIIARLQQDSDEMVNIGDEITTEAELDAKIKSAKANKAAADTHEKAWEDASSDVVDAPYCSNY